MIHEVSFSPSFSGWQEAARRALAQGWSPESVLWREATAAQATLGLSPTPEATGESKRVSTIPGRAEASAKTRPLTVPRAFLTLARRVACHRDEARWSLLYRVLWRLTRGERHLLQVAVDPDVHRLAALDRAIGRDLHKMRAFVRFRAVRPEAAAEPVFVAWFEPQHNIVELNAPFFCDRFAQMHWSILTPDGCIHWDRHALHSTPGVEKKSAPTEDAVEALWLGYYASIFNPARVKIGAMQAEMPKLYWKNLPEAALIPGLLREAPGRVNSMRRADGSKLKTEPRLPSGS